MVLPGVKPHTLSLQFNISEHIVKRIQVTEHEESVSQSASTHILPQVQLRKANDERAYFFFLFLWSSWERLKLCLFIFYFFPPPTPPAPKKNSIHTLSITVSLALSSSWLRDAYPFFGRSFPSMRETYTGQNMYINCLSPTALSFELA